MNPLTNMKNVLKLSERELGSSSRSSWHDQYKHSAWVFVGGLPFDLTEGDIIVVFSQYGEVVNINLIRDKDTGKSKGFCFLCYQDQRSTILAVDNFNGIKILGRTIRVDHVTDYKVPKTSKKKKDEKEDSCAPDENPAEKIKMEPVVLPPQDIRETLKDQIASDIKLPMRILDYTQEAATTSNNTMEEVAVKKEKKDKKEKKHKKKKSKKSKKRKLQSSDNSSDDSSTDDGKPSKRKSIIQKIYRQ